MIGITERLKQSEPFAGVPGAEVEALVRAGELRHLPAGTQLSSTQLADAYCVLLGGSIEISQVTPLGHHRTAVTDSLHNLRDLICLGVLPDSVRVRTLQSTELMCLPAASAGSGLAMHQQLDWVTRLHWGHSAAGGFDTIAIRECHAGQSPVRAGDHGLVVYVLESGAAELTREMGSAATGSRALHVGESLCGRTLEEGNLQLCCIRDSRFRVLAARRELLNAEQYADLVDAHECLRLLNQGEAELLDCRYLSEYSQMHIPQAQSLPLHKLHDRLGDLKRGRRYILCCQDGRRSALAAELLARRGYAASLLDGGITAWPFALKLNSVVRGANLGACAIQA